MPGLVGWRRSARPFAPFVAVFLAEFWLRLPAEGRKRYDTVRVDHVNDIPRAAWASVMAKARETFGARNRFGVRAYGIGPRVCGGHATHQTVLNVYVMRKLSAPQHPVPELTLMLGKHRVSIIPNVIATGRRSRADLGTRLPYSGVHAGAVISTAGRRAGRAAIGCLLTNDDAPTHLLTAGHLFGPGQRGSLVFAASGPSAPLRRIGRLSLNLLDDSGTDAALIELNAAGRQLVCERGPHLRDYLTLRDVWGRQARAFLASGGDYSRETTTAAGPTDVFLSAPTRGVFRVTETIATEGELTNAGDSGTVLCSGASNQFALGLCAGAMGAHSFFVPLDPIMARLHREVDAGLSLFEPH
jgi:hypothetical protein